MSDSDTKTHETIRDMAKLSLVSNRINEIQLKNLQTYPFVFFNGVNTASIDYDFSNKSLVSTSEDEKNLEISYQVKPQSRNFKVLYYLDIDENADNSNLDKRFETLRNSISNLFWRGILVEVYFNDKKVYTSKKDG